MDSKSQISSNSNPAFVPTSERLRILKEDVFDEWKQRLCHEIPAAKAQTCTQLRNSIPQFLDKLCFALASNTNGTVSNDEVNEISQEHGEQRAGLTGYSLIQVLKEYQILREVILSTLQNQGPILSSDQETIFLSIEQGMIEASQQFELLSLRESSASRTVLDGIRDHAIIRTNIEGHILDWNAGAEKLLGWKKTEVLGKDGSIIFTPEDLAKHDADKEMIISAREGKAEDKRWHVKKDGSRFYANGIMNSLIDREGNIFGYIKVLRDDTERLRIEEQKKEAELVAESTLKQLYDFFTQSPTPMVILEGPDHFVRLANRPYEKLVGREVNGKTVLEAFAEDEIEHFIPMLDGVYKTGKPFIGRELPLNIPNDDGEIEEHWVNVNYYPHFDESGKVKGILCDVHEVTDQVNAKKSVAESEAKFRQIANTLPNIVWTARPDGSIDWQSDKYFEYTGLGPDTLFNSKESPMHPDDMDITSKKWKASIASGKAFEIEHRIRCKDSGEYRWNLAKALPIRDKDGKIIKWVGSTTDIHDLRQAQEEIKRSEKQFRTLANSLPQFIWTATPDGLVDWYSDWWYKYLDLPPETKWDDKKTSPMHPEDVERTWPLWRESLSTGKAFYIEQRFRRGSDGQYRWHLVRAVPIKDGEGKIVKWVGANTDIHDHKELVHKLEEERELRERFIAALSHDLRTPLTSAKLSAQVLRRSYSNDEKVLRTADRIVGNIDRVDGMIQDLLDASRLSAGEKLPIKHEDVELSSIVHNTIEELRHIHGHRFTIVEEASHIEGNWDSGGIRRILENLCNNAIKYGDTHSSITIRFGCISKDMVFVSIHNGGKPIPPEYRKHLFEPFKRAADAQSSGKKGWGIGLMIVKGIVDAHGGSIEVASSESEGTTFLVKLPAKKSCF